MLIWAQRVKGQGHRVLVAVAAVVVVVVVVAAAVFNGFLECITHRL